MSKAVALKYSTLGFRSVSSVLLFWIPVRLLLASFLFGAQVPAEQSLATPVSSRVAEDSIRCPFDDAIFDAIETHNIPGAVLFIEGSDFFFEGAYGDRSLWPVVEPMSSLTLFDVASLTKVLATTPAVMVLIEESRISLDQPIFEILPEFQGEQKRRVTVRHLLTHTSGLTSGLKRDREWTGYKTGIQLACGQELGAEPGAQFTYCDVNFILLGEIVERVTHDTLDRFCKRRLFDRMQMNDTFFKPPIEMSARIAPTERIGDSVLRGVVHDPTCRRMGGVAGHAGLFSTAADIAKFARVILANGKCGAGEILKPETIRKMESVQSTATIKQKRGLGWDIDSEYSSPRGNRFPIGSFGHTGWTGCSVWIDRASTSFVVLMSNRNHPTEKGSVVQLRKTIGTLAAQAIRDPTGEAETIAHSSKAQP